MYNSEEKVGADSRLLGTPISEAEECGLFSPTGSQVADRPSTLSLMILANGYYRERA